jgi:hypothetical protein
LPFSENEKDGKTANERERTRMILAGSAIFHLIRVDSRFPGGRLDATRKTGAAEIFLGVFAIA